MRDGDASSAVMRRVRWRAGVSMIEAAAMKERK